MKNNPYTRIFLKFFGATVGIGLCVVLIFFACALLGVFGSSDIDFDALSSNFSSQVCYIDSNGEERTYTSLSAEENRIWVDLEEIPENMKNAIVSIEDERFYTHKGFDLKRTTKAFFVYLGNKITRKPTTFGGSTITQQLIKNVTMDRDRTAARKIREISSAIRLEKKLEKDEILELYLNTIYLSQGCNGVQSASLKFFGKPVGELSLAECASLAGITQYPSLYDPLVNPENNKEKQELVLSKMLELEYITQEEHDAAVAEELKFSEFDPRELETGVVHSYFVDHLIEEVTNDLIEKGYSKTLATKMLYSGGLRIVSTIDPKVQSSMEKVFEDTSNFPAGTGTEGGPQASMVVLDPYTGEIKGLVGGAGLKPGNLVLNRASGTIRQPGSTIKPIAVYAPAFEEGIITPGDMYEDKAIDYSGWTPYNYDRKFANAPISIREALRRSLNTIPVQVLQELGAENSFDFLTRKLGVTTLVKNREGSDGKVYSDIGLSQLALGGLTDGISALELTAAYVPFANRGIYTKPHCYTAVYDAEGNEILSTKIESKVAMSEEAAFVTSMILKEVVTAGTGGGAQLDSGMFTAGKTGTTSDNHDRWFVGYTPHYVASVWYGYDIPKSINVSGNPCIPVWKKVMTEINANKEKITPKAPSGVKYVTYCKKTGLLPGDECGEEVMSAYYISDFIPKDKCTKHNEEKVEEETTETVDTPTEEVESIEIPTE